MIKFIVGDIINADSEALVNTVNTEGVMGKGIALEFKESFPENYKLYKKACDAGEIKTGNMFVTHTNRLDNPKYIINFPTKQHWRNPSKIEYIKEGLIDLEKVINDYEIKSIAIPPLGCGNGKLNWKVVKPLIEKTLSGIDDINAIVYEPSEEAYKEKPKIKPKTNVGLTAARAMVLSAFEKYLILGYELTLLEAQKLAYFIQRFGENLSLEYDKNQFGPYAFKLSHLLNHLDGFYIEGMKHKDAKPFDPINIIPSKLGEVHDFIDKNCKPEQKEILMQVSELIEGFESPLGMELLSTVDFIINETKSDDPIRILDEIKNWSSEEKWNERKTNLLKKEYVGLAYDRLMQYHNILYRD
ncbi:MAG: macro domain-containing protein [Ignavibacteria bacterium]|nr:macro domain-containing protein [Ignavibacteria bacterium]